MHPMKWPVGNSIYKQAVRQEYVKNKVDLGCKDDLKRLRSFHNTNL